MAVRNPMTPDPTMSTLEDDPMVVIDDWRSKLLTSENTTSTMTRVIVAHGNYSIST
jgi:hypothetical protein